MKCRVAPAARDRNAFHRGETVSRSLPLFIGFVLVVAACREATSPPAPPSDTGLAGTYTLQTINGFAPPQIVQETDSTNLSIIAGIVIVTADSMFTDSTVLQYVTPSSVTFPIEVAKGFVRTIPDSVTFYATGFAYRMGRDDITLTQRIDGTILVYRK